VEIGRQARFLCPWARHLTGLSLPLTVRLVVTGSSLTRRPKRSLRCLLVLTNKWVSKPKTYIGYLAVGDLMFLGMQDFWFWPNLIKRVRILIIFSQICPHFALIYPNYAQENLLKRMRLHPQIIWHEMGFSTCWLYLNNLDLRDTRQKSAATLSLSLTLSPADTLSFRW